jgi:hypothetical protein
MSRSRKKYPVISGIGAEDRNDANKKERLAVKRFLKKEFDRFDEVEIPCEEDLRNRHSPLCNIPNMGKCWNKEPNEKTFRK